MHDCLIGGHQGINRTINRIKLYTNWTGLEKDVKEYIKHCQIYQEQKGNDIKQPLRITDTQNNPWDKIYLDLVGPLSKTVQDNKYLLACQDNLCKYLIAVPITDQRANEVAKQLAEKIITIFGISNMIVTDQGTNFMSDVFKRICKLFKISKISTTAYHPESNGALERSHKSLLNYIKSYIKPRDNNWDELISYACFSYNTTPHTVTKLSPYEILFGRTCNIPGELQKQQVNYNIDDIVLEIKQKMQASQRLAKENLEQFKLNQQLKDKRAKQEYQVNDLVMLKIEERNKLDPSWKGIFEIKEINWPNVTLQQIGKRKFQVVHSNRIKPYFSSLQNEVSNMDSAK